ncbi:MAG: hypothetical protein N3A57_04275, partial [Negativicutes bacterium]|nr:hypothetical protein [Negativicutes bacterium]
SRGLGDVYKRQQQHGDWLVGPQTLVVADGRQAAIIEIGPDGKYSQQTVKDGVAGHTDHYLLPDMVQFNQRNNKQSTARYQLLTAMLGRSGRWTLDDFAQIGQYQSDRDGTASLFRVGNRAGAERTTASWAVSLTPGKMPEVSIMMLDDQQNEQNWYINTGYIFSGDSQFAAGSEPPLTNDGSR